MPIQKDKDIELYEKLLDLIQTLKVIEKKVMQLEEKEDKTEDEARKLSEMIKDLCRS